MRHIRMLFLRGYGKKEKIKYKKRILRRQKSVLTQVFCSPVKRYDFQKNKYVPGKVSLCASPKVAGSMTVEAAFVLPVFLFCILFVLSFMEILRLQAGITMGLRESGRNMAAYAHGFQEKYNSLFSMVYVDQKLKLFLGEDYLEQMPFEDHCPEIHYYRSSIKNTEECIDLIALYKVVPDFNMFGNFSIPMASRYYGKAWTGYQVNGEMSEESEEENVYITPEGDVYHRNRYCTHLQLTIFQTTKENVKTERNQDGEQYLPCKYCGNRKGVGRIYITEEGNCYHTSLNCRGLKRTIDIVPISKVGNRTPCSRCGG